MSASFKDRYPAARRLLLSSTPGARLPASHRLLSPRPAFRTTSSKASLDRPSEPSTVSDRLVVLGLLTLTGLVGVGFGTAAKCQRATLVHEQIKPPTSFEKPDEEANGEQTDESASTTAESSEQGAFNPETGEINWDCPCLGGMAHGVCGEQFKAAFSCFVYSEQEPKGVECIEKFKDMQDCFREHPDQYGPELVDGDDSPSESEPASSLDTTEGTDLGDRSEQLNLNDNEFAQRTETNEKQQTDFEVEASQAPRSIPSSNAIQTHPTIPIPEASQAQPSIPPSASAGPNTPKTTSPES